MAQLRQDFAEFGKRNALLVVVGPEDAATFARFFRENKMPFIGLPDPTQRVLRLYGQEVNLFKLGRMPAQVIIDREGIVRYAHYGHSMADIPTNAELFALLDELNR